MYPDNGFHRPTQAPVHPFWSVSDTINFHSFIRSDTVYSLSLSLSHCYVLSVSVTHEGQRICMTVSHGAPDFLQLKFPQIYTLTNDIGTTIDCNNGSRGDRGIFPLVTQPEQKLSKNSLNL